jgi:hypothetical protein
MIKMHLFVTRNKLQSTSFNYVLDLSPFSLSIRALISSNYGTASTAPQLAASGFTVTTPTTLWRKAASHASSIIHNTLQTTMSQAHRADGLE